MGISRMKVKYIVVVYNENMSKQASQTIFSTIHMSSHWKKDQELLKQYIPCLPTAIPLQDPPIAWRMYYFLLEGLQM